MAVDAYNWNIIDNQDDEDVEPPLDEEVYDRMYGMMRTGASRLTLTRKNNQAEVSNSSNEIIKRGIKWKSQSCATKEKSKEKKITINIG